MLLDFEAVKNIDGIERSERWPWHRCEGRDPGETRIVVVHHFRPSNPMYASARPVDAATRLRPENQSRGVAMNSSTGAMIWYTALPTPYDCEYPGCTKRIPGLVIPRTDRM